MSCVVKETMISQEGKKTLHGITLITLLLQLHDTKVD